MPQPSFSLASFMATWHESLGRFAEAIEVATTELLSGNVLIEEGGVEPTIRLFRALDLSPIPRRRFDQLFAIRSRWKLDDLEPFLKCVVLQLARPTALN